MAEELQQLPQFRGDSAFGTWLYRIATHTAIDLWRKDKLLRLVDDVEPDSHATLAEEGVPKDLENAIGAVQQVRGALSYYPEEPGLLLQLDRLYRQQLNYLEALAMLDPQVAALYL